ncbi:MAG: glycosyltransferase [Acidimicrobiales bacterium]
MSRHALVVHTRMPAFDRDSGSQDIDNTIRFLLDDGWTVTFVSQEDEATAEQRHAERLRQMGIATYSGLDAVTRVTRSGAIDLAIIAFWEPAETVIPVIREQSPSTRIIVNSMDVHFLRHARGAFGQHSDLDHDYGDQTTRELNAYNAADAVIAVSEKERTLLGEFLGNDRVFTLPLAESIERSAVPLADRRGMFFVGNFRHVPNREAIEFLCGEVLPLLDPALLEAHPLTVIGNHLHHPDTHIDVEPTIPGCNLVGWVPSVRPYTEQSRLAVVPLLNGAGVKRKVIQAMMAYTPVVTTAVGAESLDLVQGEHALIAADAGDLAAGITRLLTDDPLWSRLAEAGAAHVDARHGIEPVRKQFDDLVATVMDRPVRVPGTDRRFTGVDSQRVDPDVVRQRIQMIGDPGAVVLVVSDGDDGLIDIGSHPCWHFPQGREGEWPGYDPVDGRAALTHLQGQQARGARYFVLPRHAFPWRTRYPELFTHLDTTARRVHHDDDLQIYDLDPDDSATLGEPVAARVQVIGTYRPERTGPPPTLLAELGASATLDVSQHWRPDHDEPVDVDPSADYVVHVRDDAVLPTHLLDELVAAQAALDVDRLQPTHTSGPRGGPPITERHRGSIAREVDAVTPLPVLSVRAGAEASGPTTLADTVTVGLRRPIDEAGQGDAYASVRRLWVRDTDGSIRVHQPRPLQATPRISVLISTYERPELLRAALVSFADQTLDRADYEVIVVDDGSADSIVDELASEFGDRLQIEAVRIDHAGRSAAKNHCVLLARAPVVLFFDDDDRARPDYLERHLAAHDRHPDEGVAILGHTDWAAELELTPLMHFITDVDRLMFAYERLADGQQLDWRGFWEGRITCKRSLLMRHGLHDQRLNYSIDVEMAWRLAPHGLRVIYDASAVSVMARPLDFEGFCARTQAKGRANAIIAALHRGTEVADRFQLDEAVARWEGNRFREAPLRRRVAELEAGSADDPTALAELHDSYREVFQLLNAKGVAEATGGVYAMPSPPTTVQPFENTDPDLAYDGTPADAPAEPLLSISIPVWSRSPELAEMVKQTIDRIWAVSRVPTEVLAIDNGSPFEVPLAAKVYRYAENKGVATGWNTGIRLSTAPVVVVMNSDCLVEPGWDEALYEAATDGRRVAFPYTDHCDGLGFTQPDQGATAGWCFMLPKDLYTEVGPFDEWFNPAFCEDTDYWHRAWEMGVELTPVPAAHVVHARRTTASTHPHVDWLLQGHRYKYGWKHGVDPHRAPPYYDREVTEYHGSFSPPPQ